MMMQCCECKGLSTYKDVSALHRHFKICHQSCKIFSCVVNDQCNRKFDKWDSYRSHIIAEHGAPLHSSQENTTPTIFNKPFDVELSSDAADSDPVEMASDPFDKEEKCSPKEFKMLLANHADLLISKLYSKPGLPRCMINDLIEDFSNFLCGPFLKKLKNYVMEILGKVDSVEVTSEVKNDVSQMFETLSEPFSHLSSEHLRFKHFMASGEYIAPEKYLICSRMERVKTKEGMKYQMKDVTGQFVPLRKVLKLFFELPDALDDTISYLKSLNVDSDIMLSNFSQCEVWKRKVAKFENDQIVLPLMVYYDDFQPNNALGPHCEKLGACYVSLPCLPTECQSRLENIFLALLFNGDDRSLYGNKACFKPLVKELHYLESEGIKVHQKSGEDVSVYFVTGLILGDNLGLNGLCGYVESFNAGYVCRICKARKDVTETMLEEDITLLRTKENYTEDVQLKNYVETGIKEECVFNELPSFEMPTDVSVDEFHDGAEGVCHYTMVPVLRHFHSIDPEFIETLNNRMYMADLGPDSDNRPPSILADRLVNNKCKLKMTGAEMYLFVRLFGFLMWDKIRDEDDQFYHLYLLLHDIVSIIHAKTVPKDVHIVLACKVKEHNALYMRLTRENLKPKHHNLVHYPRLLLLFGPLGLLSTIRLEAKHKVLKAVSNVCMTRKNLPMTVAIKQQLSLCHRFKCKASIRPKLHIGSGQVCDLKELSTFQSFSLTLPDSIFCHTSQFCAKWVEFKGTKYMQQHILVSGCDESRCFEFSEIKLILIIDKEPLFICSPMVTLGYHSNVRGYEVEYPSYVDSWFCVSPKDLVDPSPLLPLKMKSGELIIVPKNFL